MCFREGRRRELVAREAISRNGTAPPRRAKAAFDHSPSAHRTCRSRCGKLPRHVFLPSAPWGERLLPAHVPAPITGFNKVKGVQMIALKTA